MTTESNNRSERKQNHTGNETNEFHNFYTPCVTWRHAWSPTTDIPTSVDYHKQYTKLKKLNSARKYTQTFHITIILNVMLKRCWNCNHYTIHYKEKYGRDHAKRKLSKTFLSANCLSKLHTRVNQQSSQRLCLELAREIHLDTATAT